MDARKDLLNGLEGILDAHSGAIARVAKYVIENPDHVVRLSLADLSEAADAGQATVVRMCREIGLEGFTDLKLRLAADLAVRRAPAPRPQGPLARTAGHLKDSIDGTMDLIDPDALARVAERIAVARRIDVFGMGVSGVLGELLAYRLLRLGYPAIAMRDPVAAREVAAGLGPATGVIAVSQSGTTEETLRFLKLARASGAFSVAVTGYANSALSTAADATLFVGRLREPAYGGSLVDVPRAVVLFEALALALPPRTEPSNAGPDVTE